MSTEVRTTVNILPIASSETPSSPVKLKSERLISSFSQAHSWYLQTAVGSGALSLFCMLYAMFAVFFKQIGWGMRHKKEEDKMDVTGAADESAVTEWTDFLVWGLIAYAVAGTVNTHYSYRYDVGVKTGFSNCSWLRIKSL